MSKQSQARLKKRLDEAMNLSELALVTGYDRGTLASMVLPLQSGKIFYSDFRRVIAARQDRHEHSLSALQPLPFSLQPLGVTPAAASSPEAASPTKIIADRFRAPKRKGARPAASHAREECQLRSTA